MGSPHSVAAALQLPHPLLELLNSVLKTLDLFHHSRGVSLRDRGLQGVAYDQANYHQSNQQYNRADGHPKLESVEPTGEEATGTHCAAQPTASGS